MSKEMLAHAGGIDDPAGMWNQPYLETCCRAALHRLCLAGAHGRPTGLQDDPCLERMRQMGFVAPTGSGRFVVTDEGVARHATEVLKHPSAKGPAGGNAAELTGVRMTGHARGDVRGHGMGQQS